MSHREKSVFLGVGYGGVKQLKAFLAGNRIIKHYDYVAIVKTKSGIKLAEELEAAYPDLTFIINPERDSFFGDIQDSVVKVFWAPRAALTPFEFDVVKWWVHALKAEHGYAIDNPDEIARTGFEL